MTLTRVQTIVACFAAATVIAFGVQRLVPPSYSDLPLIGSIWITFYPVARLKKSEAWWAHWARGVIILVGYWVAKRVF